MRELGNGFLPLGPASAAPSVRPWRSEGGETEALELPVTPVLPSFSFSFSSCLPLVKSQGEEDVLHGIADGIESVRTTLVGYQCFFQGDIYF